MKLITKFYIIIIKPISGSEEDSLEKENKGNEFIEK